MLNKISSNEPSLVSGQDEFNFLEILNLNSLQEINQNNNINKKKKMNWIFLVPMRLA